MRIECPSCATPAALPADFAGLVKCKCGTRFDGFAHPERRPAPTPPGTTVVVVEQTFKEVKSINPPPYYDASASKRKPWVVKSLLVSAILVAAAIGGYFSQGPAPAAVAAPKSNPPAQPTEKKNNPDRITFSEIEFNSMGRNSYFLRALLSNKATVVSDWPLVEVTFLAEDKEIGKKLIPPVEYLAGETAAGRTPAPSIGAGLAVPIWMHLAMPPDMPPADAYRVRAVYQVK